MQDPRLRLFSILTLSLAAFASDGCALLAILWWAALTLRHRKYVPGRAACAIWIMVAIVAAGIHITGGNGLSYLLRMTAILIIAGWAYRGQRGGDVLDVAVWAGGRHAGFEVGLLAELAVQTLRLMEQDIAHMKTALRLKGMGWGVSSALSVALTLLISQLRRSDDQALILARRGYRHGGTLCPAFTSPWRDKIAAFCAFSILLVSLGQFVIFL
jgi:energy-coupling factor transporter transmembrane protein EcfT